MKLSEYVKYDGLGLAELVKSGDVTARELAATAIDAIAATNPQVQAVIETYDEILPDLDKKPLGDGAFAGVPFLVKDILLHQAGRKCESGSRLGAGLVAPHNSELANRFAAAGLITVGRTKTPEMGFNLTTENKFHGPVHNPWSLERSPGGSSGGSSAAVAAGMVPLAHANDGGGSIRIPASACGLFGMKPTRGRISLGPDYAEPLNGLGIEHVVSRSVRDSAAAMDATQGPALGDPYIIPAPKRSYLEEIKAGPGKLKIAVAAIPHSDRQPSKDCQKALTNTIQFCADLGHEMVEARPDLGVSWEGFLLANARVWCSSLAYWIKSLAELTGQKPSLDILEASTLACHKYGLDVSAVELHEALNIFNIVNRSVAPFFEKYDLLLTPTLPDPPQPLGTFDADAPGYTGLSWSIRTLSSCPYTPLFNVTGQPAISVPLEQNAEGLPIGMQFVAKFGDEAALFRLAGQLEAARPWITRRPIVFAG